MPPPALVAPADLDCSRIVAGPEQIRRANRQRYEFEMLDAVILADVERGVFAGYHDVKPGAWWTRGHIPERPLFPGVLMIEAAAQLASYIYATVLKQDSFLAFAGVDGVKFRGAVTPPSRLILIGSVVEVRPRRTICDAQGFVDGTMVFEGRITGMPV